MKILSLITHPHVIQNMSDFIENILICKMNKMNKGLTGLEQHEGQVKSSHLYLYSAFNNTNCDKATAQYQNGKIVSIM